MGESAKAVLQFVFIVALFAGIVSWFLEPAGAGVWTFRIAGPAVALLAITLVLTLHHRLDLAHDYLADVSPNYFARDGFCFSLVTAALDGVCVLDLYYQNQFDQPCVGSVAVDPSLSLPAAAIEAFSRIECKPGEFGVIRVPLPVATHRQGADVQVIVGASVTYPSGRGNRIRFRDGVYVRTGTNLKNTFGNSLFALGALAGALVITRRAHVRLSLPRDVATALPPYPVRAHTLWACGDQPLQSTG